MNLLKYLCFTKFVIMFALQISQKIQETAMNHGTKITGHPFSVRWLCKAGHCQSSELTNKRGVQVCPGLWAFVPPGYDVIV